MSQPKDPAEVIGHTFIIRNTFRPGGGWLVFALIGGGWTSYDHADTRGQALAKARKHGRRLQECADRRAREAKPHGI